MIEFLDYYREYLGLCKSLKQDGAMISASRRQAPVALFYQHHLISVVMNGKLVHSASPDIYHACRNLQYPTTAREVNTMLLQDIDDSILNLLPCYSYNIMIMKRMTTDRLSCKKNLSKVKIHTLSEESRGLFDRKYSARGQGIAKLAWEARLKAVKEGRYFAIIENGEIAAYSVISEIDNCAGNIVVGTKPRYRCKGYATALVCRASEWCIENSIRPIYLVDEMNHPSIAVAEKLGFKAKAKELVVSTLYGIPVTKHHIYTSSKFK
ncbi:MAG TPA: GNAT family N-acetyltransferase [Candidatus Sabulitectum sp.]|nr:GNAT family N-acetyltransferase [Candidatus Sabulitectum sp.]